MFRLLPCCRSVSRRLHYSTITVRQEPPQSATTDTQKDEDDLQDLIRRKRKTEWKRRQGGQTFLDNLIINVRGGNGGDGCVAFHREKWKPMGPPSGGTGGCGGDVYILPTPNLTTLSSVPKRVRGAAGGNGQGTWQNGKNAPPMVIKVPLGTVLRELLPGDTRRAKDEWEAEAEGLEGLGPEERRAKLRDNRWLHYPRYADDNVGRDAFKQAETALYREERARRWARKQRELAPIHIDLDKTEEIVVSDDAPLGTGRQEWLGHLVARGGRGGWGERITLSLELKILADIGLVGMPNAGKSTLLRALTGGRAKTEVASYAFTTLNPIVGVIRVADDGTFEGELQGERVFEETAIEEERLQQREISETEHQDQVLHSEDALQQPDDEQGTGHHFDIHETFRFTVADNPGLISRASENVGLGHSFLRSMERSLALVYVVDLSGPHPWDELRDLKDELEKYLPGMSDKARMVIANKADLLGGDGDQEAVEEAREKLKRFEEYVRTHMIVKAADGERVLDVVPASAKLSQNTKKVVGLMQEYVQQARAATRA